jgi:23S rRNA pseudouridine2605 synthase
MVDETLLTAMTNGVRAGNGEVLRAKQARMLRSGQKNTWLEIVLDEGKNRQIRRMLEASDIEVLRLVRVAVGPLVLGKLDKGNCRTLSSEEKGALDRAMNSEGMRRVMDVLR